MNKVTYKQTTERLATIAAIVYPLSAVPQAVKLYQTHSAESLSLLSWVGFLVVEVVFFLYGLSHGLRPIVLTGLLWFAVYGAIIAGIILYG